MNDDLSAPPQAKSTFFKGHKCFSVALLSSKQLHTSPSSSNVIAFPYYRKELEDTFCLPNHVQTLKMPNVPVLLSAAHVEVMAGKVIKAQCTFQQVSLASLSLNRAVNKSE